MIDCTTKQNSNKVENGEEMRLWKSSHSFPTWRSDRDNLQSMDRSIAKTANIITWKFATMIKHVIDQSFTNQILKPISRRLLRIQSFMFLTDFFLWKLLRKMKYTWKKIVESISERSNTGIACYLACSKRMKMRRWWCLILPNYYRSSRQFW